MQGAVYYLFVEIVDRHARNVTVRHAHVRFKVTHRYALDTSHLLSGWLNDLASLYIKPLFLTLDTFHLLSGWLKEVVLGIHPFAGMHKFALSFWSLCSRLASVLHAASLALLTRACQSSVCRSEGITARSRQSEASFVAAPEGWCKLRSRRALLLTPGSEEA